MKPISSRRNTVDHFFLDDVNYSFKELLKSYQHQTNEYTVHKFYNEYQ